MSFAELPGQAGPIEILQRSLERGRLGHAYLFCGSRIDHLEAVARTLAKTLNCGKKPRAHSGRPDSCDQCDSCHRIDGSNHPDVAWVRPESKLRVIRIEQTREMIRTVNLKPTLAEYKVGVIVGADRLNVNAANAFLKTLEEPPPCSVPILLTTDPAHLLDTILSRCLRLNFTGEENLGADAMLVSWLAQFGATAGKDQGSLLSRYRLLSVLLKKLAGMKEIIDRELSERSPLEHHDDVESDLREKWEKELDAAIEAEYRRQRADLLTGLQWWLRDVWLQSLAGDGHGLAFPSLADSTLALGKRIPAAKAMDNLRILERTQWLLGSNIQEALALEVGLLQLTL
jgi:DNA polymerase III subunit delta'